MNDAIKQLTAKALMTVCDHIAQHLDEPLTLEKLSALACCSRLIIFTGSFLAFSGQPLVSLYPVAASASHASRRLAFNLR